MAIVGHDHFAIRREAGAYKFVINPHHRVYLYGKDVVDGQELAAAQEVHLGTPDGPRLLLEPSRAGGTNYVATEPQGKSEALPEIARASARWTHMLGGVARGRAAGRRVRLLESQRRGSADLHQCRLGHRFLRHHRQVPEVGLPGRRGRRAGNSQSGATAWVVQLRDGRKAFATNAHVGGMLAEARKNHYRLVVRSPDAAHREYEIVDAILHPAYAAFNAMLADADKKASSGMLREVEPVAGL